MGCNCNNQAQGIGRMGLQSWNDLLTTDPVNPLRAMQHNQLTSVLLLIFFLFVPALSNAKPADTTADRSASVIFFHPLAFGTFGVYEGDIATSLAAGFGARTDFRKPISFWLSAMSDVLRNSDSIVAASLSGKIGVQHRVIDTAEWCQLTLRLGFNAGFVTQPKNRFLQVVGGVKWQVPIGSESYRQFFPFDFVVACGYGYDFQQHFSREIVNIGFEIDGLILLSFDVASLWKDVNPVIGVARL